MVSLVPSQNELRAMGESQIRQYIREKAVTFRKTTERFGGLSNMAPGFPIELDGTYIRTSEALYQACRFPHLPDIQNMIVQERSPMTAKMRSKPFRKHSRPDWELVRVPVMKWCLRMKLISNWDTFSELLLQTGDDPIVEDSRKDDFWGAKPDSDSLIGCNVLGRLLMELRSILRSDPQALQTANPVPIENFNFLGRPIATVTLKPSQSDRVAVVREEKTKRHTQPTML